MRTVMQIFMLIALPILLAISVYMIGLRENVADIIMWKGIAVFAMLAIMEFISNTSERVQRKSDASISSESEVNSSNRHAA